MRSSAAGAQDAAAPSFSARVSIRSSAASRSDQVAAFAYPSKSRRRSSKKLYQPGASAGAVVDQPSRIVSIVFTAAA